MNITSQGNAVDWLLGTLKRNPEGLLLLGAGAVLLMRQGGGSRTPSHAPTPSNSMLSSVADKAGEARDAAAQLTDSTMGAASEMASTVTDYAKQATHRASEQTGRVMHQAQATVQKTFGRVLADQPLAIALAGVAAGAALASIFPTSDFERETVGPISTQASQAAMEKIRGATAAAGETLESAVEERGLNAEGLKEVASDVVEAVSSSVGARGDGQSRQPGG